MDNQFGAKSKLMNSPIYFHCYGF